MSTQQRIIHDRRFNSRAPVLLDCNFSFGEDRYGAVIQDISPKGALLLSVCMPPLGTSVSINLATRHMDKPLTLEGKVVRRDCKFIEGSNINSFAVTFRHNSLELIQLIAKLSQE